MAQNAWIIFNLQMKHEMERSINLKEMNNNDHKKDTIKPILSFGGWIQKRWSSIDIPSKRIDDIESDELIILMNT